MFYYETMLKKRVIALFFLAVAVLGPSPFRTARAEPVSMVPHKALYDIRMTTRHSDAPVLNIKGQMFYEWTASCEAWTTNNKFTLVYEYADGPASYVASEFSTYETFDGTHFDFRSRRKQNGEIVEEIKGTYEDDETTPDAGTATFKIPAGISFALGPDTLFPIAHSKALIARARAGDRFFNATVFDGSDTDGPAEISAFIGPRETVSLPSEAAATGTIDETLLDSPAWPVRMAFFPMDKGKTEPDYEMTATLHENGVISDMLIEYKDFSITQKLVALETQKTSGCEK